MKFYFAIAVVSCFGGFSLGCQDDELPEREVRPKEAYCEKPGCMSFYYFRCTFICTDQGNLITPTCQWYIFGRRTHPNCTEVSCEKKLDERLNESFCEKPGFLFFYYYRCHFTCSKQGDLTTRKCQWYILGRRTYPKCNEVTCEKDTDENPNYTDIYMGPTTSSPKNPEYTNTNIEVTTSSTANPENTDTFLRITTSSTDTTEYRETLIGATKYTTENTEYSETSIGVTAPAGESRENKTQIGVTTSSTESPEFSEAPAADTSSFRDEETEIIGLRNKLKKREQIILMSP